MVSMLRVQPSPLEMWINRYAIKVTEPYTA